jgi:hypothetical protein
MKEKARNKVRSGKSAKPFSLYGEQRYRAIQSE